MTHLQPLQRHPLARPRPTSRTPSLTAHRTAAMSTGPAVTKATVKFRNAHGEQLVGDLHHCSDKLAILCHGYMCNRHWHRFPALTQALTSIGVSVLLFDFAGNGDSEGTFSLGNYLREAEDLRAAVQYARQKLQQTVVAVAGHSKGGDVVLLYAAKYDDVPLVVNIAARFDLAQGVLQRFGSDIRERLSVAGGRLPKRGRAEHCRQKEETFSWWLTSEDLAARLSLNMAAEVCKIRRSRVHTVHGAEDRTIPVADAHLFDEVVGRGGSHVVHVLPGADHNFTGEAGLALVPTVRGIFIQEGLAHE